MVGLAFLALISYGAFTTVQMRQLQAKVAALEQSQARVGQPRDWVQNFQEDGRNPRLHCSV